jgi:hypothetical protein
MEKPLATEAQNKIFLDWNASSDDKRNERPWRQTSLRMMKEAAVREFPARITGRTPALHGMTEVPCQSRNLFMVFSVSLCLCGWRFLDKLLREQG